MKRKVNLVGQNTLTVSLPSKWAQEHSIKKGDELEIAEQSNALILSTEKQLLVQRFEKDISDVPSQLIQHVIISAYTAGSDELCLKFDNLRAMDLKKNKEISIPQLIGETLDLLVGMEIVNQTSNQVVLKQITQISDDEFDNILRRVYLLLLEESDLIRQALFSKKKEASEDNITLKYRTIRKLMLYCVRVLNKKGHKDSRKTALYTNLLFCIDEVNSIYNYVALENDGKAYGPAYASLFDKVNASLRKIYELQYKFDIVAAGEIIRLRRQYFDSVNQMKKVKPEEATLVSRFTMLILKDLRLLDLLISLNN